MDSINKFMKSTRFAKMSDADKALQYAAYISFAFAIVYIFYHSQIATVGLAIGVALIMFSVTSDISVALLAGALVGLIAIHYSRHRVEGFKDPEEVEEDFDTEEEEKPKKPVKKAKKAKKVAPPPDNGDRAEFLELGKKYKMPSEDDDKDFHLDVGTTFLNAYKSLKPDQIASMTKDTQDLMQTQKQLMSTLTTLKPLITDGKEMRQTFQSYFGGSETSLN